jgi:hypothetical protein
MESLYLKKLIETPIGMKGNHLELDVILGKELFD